MAIVNRKRPVEIIDLTDDDPEAAGPESRAPKSARVAPPSSQSFNWDWPDYYDNDESVEIVDLSQGYSDQSFSSFELYGTLKTKIVGVRYYTGYATLGEMVLLRREPHNPYDANAIQVQNVTRDQIGHIPRQVAARLAPYIDDHSLLVEGIITGAKGDFDCPLALKLFGPSDRVERNNLSARMELDRLPLDALRRREKSEQAQRKVAEAAAKQGAKRGEAVQPAYSLGWVDENPHYVGSSALPTSSQSLEDIIRESERFNPRNADQVVERFGNGEDYLSKMPKASQPDGVGTELRHFQLQGLKWMLDKEFPQLPAVGSNNNTVQLWKRSTNPAHLVTNVATNYSVRDDSLQLASGGILADDMGLGKTLQVISLIMAEKAIQQRCMDRSTSDATLIIAPLTVMSNWTSQISKHVKPETALRTLVYHGLNRKTVISPAEISNYDVVISNYETVVSQYWPKGKKGPVPVPSKEGLFSVTWRRIVLDEGHNIRNPNTKKGVAASSLLAQSRWILTGTPIINTLKDLYSLVKFLRLPGGLDRFELFNGAIIRPVNSGEDRGNVLLQLLMKDICLRRKKEMSFIDLRLPELTEYMHRIEFYDYEKNAYNALQAEAEGTLSRYKAGQGKDAQKAYRHLLEILLRLRQVCNHWKLCGSERISSLLAALEDQKTVELTPENCEALQQMLQLSIESQEDCSVCLENFKEPVITACAHAFCFACIERVISTQHKCPLCRADLPDVKRLVHPAKEKRSKPNIDIDTSSSKIEALLTILQASAKKPGTKTVIFSQWTAFLDILQIQLDKNGYFYTRIDGSMATADRDSAIDALENDPSVTIMLASLQVGAVGLNLVAANQVILADSWWAPAIEDQAVDRVHRLGQKRPTTVFRLVMEGSIEEKVLDIQKEKRRLAMLALSENEGKRNGGKTARLADIERLLR